MDLYVVKWTQLWNISSGPRLALTEELTGLSRVNRNGTTTVFLMINAKEINDRASEIFNLVKLTINGNKRGTTINQFSLRYKVSFAAGR